MIAMKPNGINLKCLDHSDLVQVINGEWPAERFDSALAHLEHCERCRRVAESIQTDEAPSLDGPAADELQQETACQAALARLLEASSPPLSRSPDDRLGGRGMPIEDSFHRDVEPRQTLGPYRILRPLGAGGMSTVLLAEHQRLRRRCAIKLLPRERVDQPGWLDRFEREMVVVAALQHAHIVSATDAGHEDGWHYLVMEYLDGLDVGCLARRLGPLPVADACEIVRQAALGLSEIHAAGLVHRDIKPSNLMLTRSGIVKVLDLGLVLAGDDPIGIDDRLTTVGHLMGTVAFMSPEQLADSRDVDARADVYSLGATLYRLIAGRSPFESRGGLTKQILAITQTDAPRLDAIREDVPADVTDLVALMLDRNPGSRPSTAAEIAERLAPCTTGHRLKRLVRSASRNMEEESPSLQNHPLSLAASRKPPRRGNRWWLAGGLFAFAILAAIVLRIQTDRGTLVVHSEADDLTLVVSQDDQVVERLQIDSAGDHRTVLRKGSYRVAIEGGGEALKLSDEVVTIGRGGQSAIEIRPKTLGVEAASNTEQTLLFQGQSFDHWMGILENERDVHRVSDAISAIEILSRDTDHRETAASATLQLARRWGDSNANSSSDPETELGRAYVYKTALYGNFPAYFPMPGLRVIANELENGNAKSRLRSVSLLGRFRAGPSEGHDPTYGRERAIDELERFVIQPKGTELIGSIIERIQPIAAGEVDAGDSLATKRAAESALDSALWLSLSVDSKSIDTVWIQRAVRERIDARTEQWAAVDDQGNRAHPGSHGIPRSGLENLWGLSEDELLAAVRLRERDDLLARWDEYLCAVMIDKWFQRFSHRSDEAFALLSEYAPQVLLDQIAKELESMRVPVVGTWSRLRSDRRRGTNVPASLLAEPNSIWTLALPFYAERITPDPSKVELLVTLDGVIRGFESPTIDAEDFRLLKSAIERLVERSSR
ncbi:serine/threonine protein kinase [Allorhodopirellula solitaria]|uniref:Serine/threonine-protein kinase PrkC n=1 Tax=Allorhodopirellula solitaria TaxID=2527987 RepID=A0A5C5XQP9_9BACT|nr:serine/threonine-protein kinase [Allorhodopirellula solitaria]TWT64968.1 Serine/threonine-protein kinase PrkC [Allorhodopirellula solitaria]